MDSRFCLPTNISTDSNPLEIDVGHADPPMNYCDISQLMAFYGIAGPLNSLQLDNAEFANSYLVDGLLIEGQSCILAGAPKTMKTSIAIDLALSLGESKKFLGEYNVSESRKVLFLSAESGGATIQETARRIAKAKGASLGDDTNVSWGFWVPKASNEEQLRILDHQLNQTDASVLIIDPLYQVLDGENQANLSLNGQQLQTVCQQCLGRNVTPILIDHVKRSSINAQANKMLELTDVTGAGKAEYFRQWMLISRRETFNPDTPIHRLWMNVGGSAGHCGLKAIDIDETRNHLGERFWGVQVGSALDAKDQAVQRRESKQTEQRKATHEKRAKKLLDVFIEAHPSGLTQTEAAERAGQNARICRDTLAALVVEGILVKESDNRNNRKCINYKWKPTTGQKDNSDKKTTPTKW